MKRELYRYQRRAAKALYERGCGALFAGVGTGKTAILLHVAWRLLTTFQAGACLVVAPIAVVKSVWAQEAKNWPELAQARFSVVLGSQTQRLAALQQPADFYLINYENLVWLLNLKKRVRLPDFDILILDESTMVKNPGSIRFKGHGRQKKKDKKTGKVVNIPAKVGLRAQIDKHRFRYRFVMTGTPKPGEYYDLWSQIYVVDGGRRLGPTITEFKSVHYHQYGPLPYQIRLRTGHDVDIQGRLADICHYIPESDIEHELPKVVERDYVVRLPPKVRRLYDEFEADLIVKLDDDTVVSADSVGVLSNKLRQVGQGGLYVDDQHNWSLLHDEKLEMLDALVEDLGDRRAIVTYAFRHDLERMLRWRKAPVLNSQLSSAAFNRVIAAWNAGKLPLIYGHPGSMGHGLNLQSGGYDIIMFGLNWGLERYQQVVGRLRRTGQQAKRVFVHRIVARATIETDLMLPRLRDADVSQAAFLRSFLAYRAKVLQRNQALAAKR